MYESIIKNYLNVRKHERLYHAGLLGSGQWSEALNDVIVETMQEVIDTVLSKVSPWKILDMEPEPENSSKLLEGIRADLIKRVSYVQSIAEKHGKNFILCDKVRMSWSSIPRSDVMWLSQAPINI